MSKRILFTLIALTLSFAANAGDVQYDYDTARDFSEFRYYDWQPQTDSIDESFKLLSVDQLKELLAYNLERQMEHASEKFPANFLVRFYIKPMKKFVDDRPRIGIGMGGFNDGMGGGVSFSFPLGGNELDQTAQVVIDFLDPKTQQLVWRGSVVTNLSSTSVPMNQGQLGKAFAAILKKFPPKN